MMNKTFYSCLLFIVFHMAAWSNEVADPFGCGAYSNYAGYEALPYLFAAKGGGGGGGGQQTPTTISTINNLGFEPGIAGMSQILVTLPSDFRAAVFEASGEPWGVVTISVVEASIFMLNVDTANKADKIRVDQFQTGGSLDPQGRGVLNQYGVLDDIRVGANAEVTSKEQAGSYRGTATLRLVYN